MSAMAGKRFVEAYKSFFNPKPVSPPFLHVCQVGDPVLRTATKPVVLECLDSPEIKQVILQMKQVMKRYDSVGLAAPQIGIPLSMILLEFSPKRKEQFGADVYAAREMSTLPLTLVINPKMEVIDYNKIELPESCESIRGYSAVVPRYKAVRLSGVDVKGEPVVLEKKGWLARIIQHEMDHLHGKLYIDCMTARTFQNDGWHRINVHQGRVKIEFHKK
ncbi:peptide deformylase, mitochondrial-like isoform X2 [Portunus trituberculatus]|uniref:peptide deformylase, mitochondrial-like isoform X2 n=1 Tax=Portunus trituberculatus TaxID=210409 RepID=UPI001E1CF361|nr:peptide deformylase, mitochondrial-like isoform X2 [Portunus trituberculatus]XP_045102619.1 peptide deformylase, mitochondrial-like isoform X2 [Portunus trituberculatus]